MSSSVVEVRQALATRVRVTNESLVVDLADGRTLAVPYGTPSQRSKWRLIGRGEGIHWPDLDEDLSVEGLLAGQASGESRTALQKWLKARGLPSNKRLQPTSRARRRAPK